MSRAQEKAEFRAEAARRMDGFCYTQAVSTDRVEVWHCQKPGTGVYHFDITVLRTGMAVTGDMDGFLFEVGGFGSNAYGIPFLTHPNKSYVAEKLESQSRKMEFDQDYFKKIIAEQAAYLIGESGAMSGLVSDENGDDLPTTPDWIKDGGAANFSDMATWLLNATVACKDLTGRLYAQELLDEMDFSKRIESTNEAYQFLSDSGTFLFRDVGDFTLDKLDGELIQRLYMLDHAATAILAIKFPENAKQPEDATS